MKTQDELNKSGEIHGSEFDRRKRPTIAELEAAIDSGQHIELKPDGTVVTHSRPTIDQVLAEVGNEHNKPAWPGPTPEMMNDPEFNAVWDCIKKWDINVPEQYHGYSQATGNHVVAILNALKTPLRERRLFEKLLAEATLYFDRGDEDAMDFHRRLGDMGLTYGHWKNRNFPVKKDNSGFSSDYLSEQTELHKDDVK